MDVELKPIGLSDAGEIERAVSAFAGSPNGGLIVVVSGASLIHREFIVTLAARHQLPVVYPYRVFVTGGGLTKVDAGHGSSASTGRRHHGHRRGTAATVLVAGRARRANSPSTTRMAVSSPPSRAAVSLAAMRSAVALNAAMSRSARSRSRSKSAR
ncbi:MAG: hypothetical protein JO012_08600 [Hyphomicrobiales bacterium]|nr:hypothetical protein [Hyphomicrobiales bacterium]